MSQNEWAFLPGYPALVRLVMEAAGVGFPVAATVVSLVAAQTALILLYWMVMQRGGHSVAFTAVLAVCVYPTSTVLQLPYAESAALLLVVLALALLGARRYLFLIPVCLALALTRQVMVALALVILAHAMSRWLRRREDLVSKGEWLSLLVALIVCSASTLLWPAIAATVTGVPDAYFQTYAAWLGLPPGLSRGMIGTSLTDGGPFAWAILLLVVYVALVASNPASRLLGPDLRVWSFAYPLYLLAVTGVGGSFPRYFMLSIGPLLPLPWAPTTAQWRRSERARWVFVGACAVVGLGVQYAWVARVFIIGEAPGITP